MSSAPTVKIMIGDALEKLKELPDKSVHCVCTSPPYFHQRDYSKCQCSKGAYLSEESVPANERDTQAVGGPTKKNYRHGKADPNCPICKGTGIIEGMKDHQLGLEKSPEEYVEKLVEVFREVKRVLRDDGTLWIVIGDSYATMSGGMEQLKRLGTDTPQYGAISYAEGYVGVSQDGKQGNDLKHKDLMGIPWRTAFALQAPYRKCLTCGTEAHDSRWGKVRDKTGTTHFICPECLAIRVHKISEEGWYLRSEIIWSKPNPMPESVTDRPTKSHEQIFFFTKSSSYHYDQEAIREVYNYDGRRDTMMKGSKKYASSLFSDQTTQTVHERGHERWPSSGRNARSVWEIATEPYQDAHFAVFSRELPERCIKAGSSERGCCSKCGAPWERIVETERTFESGSGRAGHIPSGKSGPFLQGGGETIDIRRGPVTATTTTGWQPTCGCYTVQEVLSESGIVPCTVLDPFAGSGTTGEVARSLGRSSILIELNPQYEPMIKKRVLPEVKPFTEFGDEKHEDSKAI